MDRRLVDRKLGDKWIGDGSVEDGLIGYGWVGDGLIEAKAKRESIRFEGNATNSKKMRSSMFNILTSDPMAKVMPMQEIMNRIIVDQRLHAGEVSDTQLALADMKARRFGHKKTGSARSGDLDCSPFCK
ncbi:hypothetical protein GUITHDRAFT_103710 [Guillardia theta CCMP2712]|uniref:Uncharacterized protein n=1 Tax=Guillardia theta (strain CCMP2712) TaxID=905079 RepID=L1JPG0_GUITC|nr:hypothetical protein GUITHDRAFT_103710 [Guillardia theta CCMP2712]EKX50476.1 hypothetical protein GUITHDRAFT_103710 [Guillardia theta CCMP2712]|eukprot:XP_005837456.1 hypothetical protein GUITHDRAFT_103710 [Guillardia theta CCMP2712]